MTMETIYEVGKKRSRQAVCGDCGRVAPEEADLSDAGLAGEAGWQTVVVGNRVAHLCPDCAASDGIECEGSASPAPPQIGE